MHGQPTSVETTKRENLERKRPPISRWERWTLRREIRRAATRLRKRSISEFQYAAIVLYNSQRLLGKIAAGESLRGWEFGTWTHLPAWDVLEQGNLVRSLRRYGPWNMAGIWLRTHLRPPKELHDVVFEVEWDEEADAVLEEARLRLKWWPRLKFGWEERMDRNRRYFPHVSDRMGKLVLVVFSGLAGAILGALTTLMLGG